MTNTKNISKADGELIVKTARKIVTEFIQNNNKMKLDPEFNSKFSFPSGIFVTLNKKNNLRGCIGYPLPNQSLSQALIDASISAATEDPRFNSVTFDELDEITFEVTILTQPQEIIVDNPSQYPSQIKIGRDGLIVKHSFYSGLLLPQVPIEYGWNEEEFLEHTCEKAGLEKNFWKRDDVTISKFEGIIFKEEKPNGNVIQEIL